MLVGYMRVSKSDGSQVSDLQRDALLAVGVDPRHLYEDATSGKRDDRPGLEACLKALRPGDTLVVWKLDRLGRNLRHLVILVEDLPPAAAFPEAAPQGPPAGPPLAHPERPVQTAQYRALPGSGARRRGC